MKRSTVIALAVSALGLSACQEDFAVKDVYEICENITCGGIATGFGWGSGSTIGIISS